MRIYSNVEVYGAEYPVTPIRKLLSRFIFILQIIIILFCFGGESVRGYLSFIPGYVFEFVEKKKWILLIFAFLLGNQLMSALTSSGAFEIYLNDNLVY
jgi:hypothetical protein